MNTAGAVELRKIKKHFFISCTCALFLLEFLGLLLPRILYQTGKVYLGIRFLKKLFPSKVLMWYRNESNFWPSFFSMVLPTNLAFDNILLKIRRYRHCYRAGIDIDVTSLSKT